MKIMNNKKSKKNFQKMKKMPLETYLFPASLSWIGKKICINGMMELAEGIYNKIYQLDNFYCIPKEQREQLFRDIRKCNVFFSILQRDINVYLQIKIHNDDILSADQDLRLLEATISNLFGTYHIKMKELDQYARFRFMHKLYNLGNGREANVGDYLKSDKWVSEFQMQDYNFHESGKAVFDRQFIEGTQGQLALCFLEFRDSTECEDVLNHPAVYCSYRAFQPVRDKVVRKSIRERYIGSEKQFKNAKRKYLDVDEEISEDQGLYVNAECILVVRGTDSKELHQILRELRNTGIVNIYYEKKAVIDSLAGLENQCMFYRIMKRDEAAKIFGAIQKSDTERVEIYKKVIQERKQIDIKAFIE